MKTALLSHLICPACLPRERSLELSSGKEEGNDIISGTLSCGSCRRRYPVREGIAILLPDPDSTPSGGQWRYEEAATVDSYLWSHFADILDDADAGNAYQTWAATLSSGVAAFDAGCAVGRLTFEMANHSELAVGCDLSQAFVRTARRLARERRITFSLPLEGNLRQPFHLSLPPSWRTDNLEFIVADALALPFARNTFDQVASLNLVDRVRHPLAHLYEINRIARESGAGILFSDPFSWTSANTPEDKWLGGVATGNFSGRGLDNVKALLEGKDGILLPKWHITGTDRVEWRMRSHSNHFEMIRSEMLVAQR